MWTSMNSFSKCRGINCMSPASQQVIMTLEDYIKGQQNKTLLAPENSVVSLPKKAIPPFINISTILKSEKVLNMPNL